MTVVPAAGGRWHVALLATFAAVAVAVSGWVAVGAPGTMPGSSVPLILASLVSIGAGCYAIQASRAAALDALTRDFWRFVAVSQLLPAILRITTAPLPGMGSLDAALLNHVIAPITAQLLLLVALLRLPSAPRRGFDRIKMWLDVSTVLVGGLLVAWYDHFTSAQRAREAVMLTSMLHITAIMDLVLLLVVSILWRRTLLRHRTIVLEIVAGAILIHFLGHLCVIGNLILGNGITGWADVIRPLGALCIGIAAWYKQSALLERRVRHRPELARTSVAVTLMTYACVLPGFVLLLKTANEHAAQPLGGLVVGGVALTALAFVRQVVGTRESLRMHAESTARNNEARFRALVQHSSDVITIVDADGTIRYASPSVWTVLGHDPVKLVGTKLAGLIHDEDLMFAEGFLEDLARATAPRGASTPGTLKREWRIRHANGDWMTVDNVGTNLLAEPVIEGLVLNTRDVTEQSVIKQQYMHQAFHDPLTDLANRSLFLYQVGHALSRAARHSQNVTVLFLDLDNFKTVNDSLGHAAGDLLLVEASRRIYACVRDTDLIARLGGDEFAVLVESAEDLQEVYEVADRIATALAKPFAISGKEVFVSSSIGIARGNVGETSDELVRNADVAMYVAKTRGKGQAVLFEPQMHTAALERLVVEADLRRAIEREEFLVEYQPIVLLTTGEIIGAEALVRWCTRDRGTVAPGVFIPIAEETGLIVQIGRWVLRKACQTTVAWERERGIPMRITVNLSGRQLQEPGIVEDVRQALAESGLDPAHLVIEITESMLMHNTELSMDRLHALKALGVSLAIDDFGTGYSSLSYLQRYPIDILKIDKAFVDAIDKGGEGPVLASAIVALGETLRLNTVAEGIESDAQRAHLVILGCELGQGFLFAPPLGQDAFWRLLIARGAKSLESVRRPREASARAA